MPRMRVTGGAFRKGAPFSLLLALALWAGSAAALDCPSRQLDEVARVDYVYDGDTVRLADGRRVRFIGINTPEMGRDGRPGEAYAQAARQALVDILAADDHRLGLRFGAERHDRYGRTLAHPYRPDGASLNAVLLERGLATTLTVPPNLASRTCYRAVEREARRRGAGIWSLARYAVTESRDLPAAADGYRLVSGRVVAAESGRGGVGLRLEGGLLLQIRPVDLQWFEHPESLRGRRVQVRGWVHSGGGGLRMRVRHPADLSVLED